MYTLQHCSAGDVPDNPDPGVPELLPEVAVLPVRGGQVAAVDTHVITVPLLAPSHSFSERGLILNKPSQRSTEKAPNRASYLLKESIKTSTDGFNNLC